MITDHINYHFKSKTYRINISGNNILIDPGDEWEGFYNVSTVLLTHAHFDHIYGLNKVIELNPQVKVYTNESGREMLLNARKNLSFYHESPFVISDPSRIVTVKEGQEIPIGDEMTAKAIFTPGHNPSCITWLIDDCLFTGDSYIPGIKTVTNLPGGNKQQAEESLALIKHLAKARTIYPGHTVDINSMKGSRTDTR